jgi:hypothetical protein
MTKGESNCEKRNRNNGPKGIRGMKEGTNMKVRNKLVFPRD